MGLQCFRSICICLSLLHECCWISMQMGRIVEFCWPACWRLWVHKPMISSH